MKRGGAHWPHTARTNVGRVARPKGMKREGEGGRLARWEVGTELDRAKSPGLRDEEA